MLRAALALLVLAGCPHRGPDPEARLRSLLDAADAAWERRGELGLDKAGEPLLAAWSAAPDDPKVAWRVARWRLTEGMSAPDDALARSSYAQAREVAIGCLESDPLFAQRRASEGWVVALAGLSPDRSRCAAWAALSWARWMDVLGGGAAALDLEALDALVGSSEASTQGGANGIARWADGIVAAVRPPWAGRDPARAEAALRDAIRADPRAVVRWADLYRLVIVPNGTPEEQATLRSEILAMPAVTPEDQRARQVVEGDATAAR